MWGPLLAWCALELLAESIDAGNPEAVALDLFDRLRLREPFAQAFTALGFDGEEGWRVAARIKVVLLTAAGVGQPSEVAHVEASPAVAEAAVDVYESTAAEAELAIPASDPVGASTRAETKPPTDDESVAIAPALWLDPDVRWLTGAHEAEGHSYLVRESYEELLWWLLMPALLRLAGEPAPNRAAAEAMSKNVDEAIASAEAAGYRIDALIRGSGAAAEAGKPEEILIEADEVEPTEGVSEEVHPLGLDSPLPQAPEPSQEKPAE
jgi:hypothetical protein